jgi:hypothetical protein
VGVGVFSEDGLFCRQIQPCTQNLSSLSFLKVERNPILYAIRAFPLEFWTAQKKEVFGILDCYMIPGFVVFFLKSICFLMLP